MSRICKTSSRQINRTNFSYLSKQKAVNVTSLCFHGVCLYPLNIFVNKYISVFIMDRGMGIDRLLVFKYLLLGIGDWVYDIF